jgi:uncharacterized OB-fold protein
MGGTVQDVKMVDPTLLAEGQRPGDRALLRASKCEECGRTEFPAHTTCPACASPSNQITLGPAGRLLGFTEVLHQPPGAELDVPYTIAVAAFDDVNLAVMGVLDHHMRSQDLEVGQPLEVTVVATRDSATYGFRLA